MPAWDADIPGLVCEPGMMKQSLLEVLDVTKPVGRFGLGQEAKDLSAALRYQVVAWEVLECQAWVCHDEEPVCRLGMS
jgi:hypothetical protein